MPEYPLALLQMRSHQDCCYEYQEYPNSANRHVTKGSALGEYINDVLEYTNAATVVMLMRQLEIETFEPTIYMLPAKFIECFPYGCFAKSSLISYRKGVPYQQWLMGKLELDGGYYSFWHRVQLAAIDMRPTFNVIGTKGMDMSTINKLRFDRTIGPLIVNRYAYSGTWHMAYPFLYHLHPHFEADAQSIRPVWSKEHHRYLDPLFRKAVKTVLLMIRFRARNFNFRPDLLPLLLNELFEQHLDQLHNHAVKFRAKYDELTAMSFSSRMKFSADEFGLIVEQYGNEVMKTRDITALCFGYRLDDDHLHIYRHYLFRSIMSSRKLTTTKRFEANVLYLLNAYPGEHHKGKKYDDMRDLVRNILDDLVELITERMKLSAFLYDHRVQTIHAKAVVDKYQDRLLEYNTKRG